MPSQNSDVELNRKEQIANEISLTRYDIRLCRMIYLLCKYDIISVPTYAKRISSAKQISYRQVYHP